MISDAHRSAKDLCPVLVADPGQDLPTMLRMLAYAMEQATDLPDDEPAGTPPTDSLEVAP